MPDQERSIIFDKRIVQMISDIVCVQLLLGRVDLGVAMDDYVTGCLFSENLRIDVRDMLRQDNGHVNAAFPCVAFGVFQVYRRNRLIQKTLFPLVHRFQLVREAFKIVLDPVSRPHRDEVFLFAPAADQCIDPVGRKIGDFAPVSV